MGLFNLFGGDSSSSTSNRTENFDQRATTQNGPAFTNTSAPVTVNTSDPLIVGQALDLSKADLAAVLNFVDAQTTKIFTTVNAQQEGAASNIRAAQDLAAEGISEASQTASNQVLNFLKVASVIGVVMYAINKGYFKGGLK